MAGTKELKERIKSVQETKKITSAMHLIASTKLRRARVDLAATRPYFDALRAEFAHVFRACGDVGGRYVLGEDGSLPAGGEAGLLVITADKGLAGAYNVSVLRLMEELVRERPDSRVFMVGDYGRRYCQAHGLALDPGFDQPARKPSFDQARSICSYLLALYAAGKLNELTLIYTDMKSALKSTALRQRLLPLERDALGQAADGAGAREFEFIPSAQEVLQGLLRSYLGGFVYSALVDSFCSEQNARVNAMDAANRSAEELLGDLSLQLNRERQSAITQEITEVSAGAKAQAQQRIRRKEAASL